MNDDSFENEPLSFSELLWKKIREEMRIEVLRDKAPSKKLKLYELTEEEIGIDIEQVKKWSSNNQNLYFEISENGFAEFLCNKEYLRQIYNELFFANLNIQQMDNELVKLSNLKILNLNQNQIQKIENLPSNLSELHIYNNPIKEIKNKGTSNLVFLGVGNAELNDNQLPNIVRMFPQLLCLDIQYNQLVDQETTMDYIKRMSKLKIIALFGNPISLLPVYRKTLLEELPWVKFIDEEDADMIRKQIQEKKEQAEQEKIRREQELQKQRELEALQAQQKDQKKGAKDTKKDVKAVAQPQASNTQLDKAVLEEDKPIQITDPNSVTFKLIIRTIENTSFVLIDKSLVESTSNPNMYQSYYYVQYTVLEQIIESNKIGAENGQIENEKIRIDLDHTQSFTYKPSSQLRDFIFKGLVIYIKAITPIVEINPETEEVKPKIINNEVQTIESNIGVIKINLRDWIRGYNKNIQLKYPLFDHSVANLTEFIFKRDDEIEGIERNKQYLKELEEQKAKEEQEKLNLILQQQQATSNNKKGKDQKKKDDKKNVKKGKEEVVKTVPALDWKVDDRLKIFVKDKHILSSQKELVAVNISIEQI